VCHVAERVGVAEHVEEAIADAILTLDALRAEGLVGPIGLELQIESPIAGAGDGGRLLSG
jgi:hypothetical protein